ncbi:MAG TPA: hypothetical protein VGT05_01665 [Patescibacteria group bacterium]|nr:hypothetical protein [Patescibacteria group bacterium]
MSREDENNIMNDNELPGQSWRDLLIQLEHSNFPGIPLDPDPEAVAEREIVLQQTGRILQKSASSVYLSDLLSTSEETRFKQFGKEFIVFPHMDKEFQEKPYNQKEYFHTVQLDTGLDIPLRVRFSAIGNKKSLFYIKADVDTDELRRCHLMWTEENGKSDINPFWRNLFNNVQLAIRFPKEILKGGLFHKPLAEEYTSELYIPSWMKEHNYIPVRPSFQLFTPTNVSKDPHNQRSGASDALFLRMQYIQNMRGRLLLPE